MLHPDPPNHAPRAPSGESRAINRAVDPVGSETGAAFMPAVVVVAEVIGSRLALRQSPSEMAVAVLDGLEDAGFVLKRIEQRSRSDEQRGEWG